MKRTIAAVAAATLLIPAAGAAAGQAAMTPASAIAAAQAAPGNEVSGTFEMVVGSTGASGYDVFLNSSADYHDAANLTVVIHPGARAALKARLGAEPEDVMTGRRVRVTGTAVRVGMAHRDGTTVYQTRVAVDRIDQLVLVG